MAELSPVLPPRNSVAMKEARALATDHPTAAALGNILLLESNDSLLQQVHKLKTKRNELQQRLKIATERYDTSGVSAIL